MRKILGYRELWWKRRCCERKEESLSGIFFSYRESLILFTISRGNSHCLQEGCFSPLSKFSFTRYLNALTTRNFCLSKLECHEGYSRARRSSQRTGNHGRRTRTRACCIFYILLTFTPDTVRSLVLSECRQKVWRFRGERQDRVGSKVLYFLHERGLCGCDCGVARFVRYADRSGPRAEHLLTSSLICDSARFRPTSGYSSLSFFSYACNNRNIILYLKKK